MREIERFLQRADMVALIKKWEIEHEKVKHINHREAAVIRLFIKDLRLYQKKTLEDL